MQLPFPERISIKYAAIFASALFVVQQMQGTDPYFSMCAFFFILIATFAFNMAGGFTQPSGGYVFFYATLGAIVGWVSKACLGEAADSNLLVPKLTALVFLGGIVSIAVAVYLSKKLRPRRSPLETLLKEKDASAAVMGCAVVGVILTVLLNVFPHEDGGLISLAGQLNDWLPLAIILGVTHEIRRSGGRRSVNAVILAAAAVSFVVGGLIGFSKEGLFTPIVCYVIAAASMRYRVSVRQLAGTALVLYLMLTYLVPYSQYGRNQRSKEDIATIDRFKENADTAGELITDLGTVKQNYDASQKQQAETGGKTYFQTDQGLLERLEMIQPDDLLIDATERGRQEFGLAPLAWAAGDAVPHFIWPDKPSYLLGNMYAHEIGGIIDDRDLTTGISFSPSGDAYHMARWLGVLLVMPTLLFVVFTFTDAVFGDTRKSPWGLFVLVLFAHIAPEGMLSGMILIVTRFGPSLIFAALVCAYAMPLAASIFVRPRQAAPASI